MSAVSWMCAQPRCHQLDMGFSLITPLDRFLDRLISAIDANIQPNVGLIDTYTGQATPSDHYGNISAALALACNRPDRWTAGYDALQAWLALPFEKVDHLPFNRLLLVLLRDIPGEGFLSPAHLLSVNEGIRRCHLRRRYRSNNWSLLAQTCRLIEASRLRKAAAAKTLSTMIQRWTTPKGCFIDFPERPKASYCTPLAYHHKALFLASLACWFCDDPELGWQAKRLSAWLVHCWDSNGYAGGFGRSTHSLFGDACLMAGLILLGIDDCDESSPINALINRLEQQRRPDGFYWLNPAGRDTANASWDSYMHLSVYNAWAAAIICTARHLRRQRDVPECLRDAQWTADQPGIFHDEAAGLAILRCESGFRALFSTRGQPPQATSKAEVDLRYAGGQLYHASTSPNRALVTPPLKLEKDILMGNPAYAGLIPLFSDGKRIFALSEFDDVQLCPIQDGLGMILRGRPRATSIATSRTALHRLFYALDWRLTGGHVLCRMALKLDAHPGVTGQLTISISSTRLQLNFELLLDVLSDADLTYLNPPGSPTEDISLAATEWHRNPCSSIAGNNFPCLPPERIRPGHHRWSATFLLFNRTPEAILG